MNFGIPDAFKRDALSQIAYERYNGDNDIEQHNGIYVGPEPFLGALEEP